MIRDITLKDAKDICNIYNDYIKNTIITFEERPVEVEEMKNRIGDVTQNYPWLVYEENKKIIGYAYATR